MFAAMMPRSAAWIASLFVALTVAAALCMQNESANGERWWSVREVRAQNPTMNLPSGSVFTYWAFSSSSTTPLAATQVRTTNGRVVSLPSNFITYESTNIPCQGPFDGGLNPNADLGSRPQIEHTSSTTVTGSSVAFWVYISDYEFSKTPQEFFAREVTATSSFDLRMGMLRSSGSPAVEGYNMFCTGQGITTTANVPNSPVNACVFAGVVPVQVWTHIGIKMTRNASAYPRIYINGALQNLVYSAGAFVSGPSFNSATPGFFLGRSTLNDNAMNGLLRNLVTTVGVFSDADFAYLGSSNNVINTASECDPVTYCAAKGNTPSRCYALRSQCRYNFESQTCLAGPPSTCAQFETDTVGCSANPQCTVQNYNGNKCANRCNLLSNQECVGTVPIRQDCRLNYTSMLCYESTAYIDGCSNQISGTSCRNVGCYFDPYLQNCFVSQTQFKQVFPCSYFSQRSDTACSDESCVQLADRTCVNAVTTSNTADNSTSINYARKIFFLNPRIVPNTLRFQLTIAVPFATSATPRDAWPFNPSWPIFQVLFPVSNIGAYAKIVNPLCRSV